METVFQLQPTSIVTKELFRLRCSLYPHNIKEVELSEKAHKVKECACLMLWLNWYMTYKKDTNFTFYIWLNPLSLSSTPTMSFEGRWPKQPDPHNSLCRTFPRLEIKFIQCHRLHTCPLIYWLVDCLSHPHLSLSVAHQGAWGFGLLVVVFGRLLRVQTTFKNTNYSNHASLWAPTVLLCTGGLGPPCLCLGNRSLSQSLEFFSSSSSSSSLVTNLLTTSVVQRWNLFPL